MDRPDVRFATTSDGVTIAHWSIGTGPPLVVTQSFSLSHAELEWGVPSMADLYRELASRHRVVRFDPRHAGLSDNGTDLDTTLSGMGNDLTAVADASDLERFALLAVATMGPVAIQYAATHPERVSQLILADAAAFVVRGEDDSDAHQALVRSEETMLAARLFHEATSPEDINGVVALAAGAGVDLAGIAGDVMAWDASPRLHELEAPVLVMSSNGGAVPRELARALAAAAPTGQLRTIDAAYLPYFADQAPVLEAITGFLGTADRPMRGGFTTVVFTDLVASTEVVNRLGDAEGRAAFRRVEQATAAMAAKHDGDVVKHTGDGAMLAFPSTSAALSFAVALLEVMDESPMDLRIGIAAGEPIREGGDLHGAVVHQASRVTDRAGAAEIIVADSVRQLALGKGFAFEDAGEASLKGFDEPVRLWRVTGS